MTIEKIWKLFKGASLKQDEVLKFSYCYHCEGYWPSERVQQCTLCHTQICQDCQEQDVHNQRIH